MSQRQGPDLCELPSCRKELPERKPGQRGRRRKYCEPAHQVQHYNEMHPRIDLSKMPAEQGK